VGICISVDPIFGGTDDNKIGATDGNSIDDNIMIVDVLKLGWSDRVGNGHVRRHECG